MPMRSDVGGTSDDMITVGLSIAQAISELRQALNAFAGLFGVAATTGLFTTTAAATIVVPNPNVTANSIIQLQAVNAAAGTLQGAANALYVDRAATVAGVSFSVKTANAAAATAAADFSYIVFNPLA